MNGLSFFNMALTERELTERKEKLHEYLSKVCASDDIANSSLMKEFFGDHTKNTDSAPKPDASEPAKRKIILPDPEADEDDEAEQDQVDEAPKQAAAKLFANVMDDDDEDLIPAKKPAAERNAAAEEAASIKSAAAIAAISRVI